VGQVAAVALQETHGWLAPWRPARPRSWRPAWRWRWRLLGGFVAVIALPACDGPGSTTDIAAAEAEIAAAVDAVADGLGLEPRREQLLGTRSRCEWVADQPGASNTIGVVGVPTVEDDPLDRGAQLILEAGFELVDAGLPDTVFGRREGMRLTVVLGPGGEVFVDGATGCKPMAGR
jgi:hypothetical protein